MANHPHTNRLIHEKSPYLLQHAHNPVDWFPWGAEALQKARDENKPVLVSIGYATCHWCHVMERESFEDAALAQTLNEHFVAIKVDREERPDVDKVHMDALHAMGEQGGWPLNVFLTPQGEPFYGGTYWPPQLRWGRPSFGQVLHAVADTWASREDHVRQQAGQLTQHLQNALPPAKTRGATLDFSCEEKDADLHRQMYDERHGGFCFHQHNKFPPSMGLLSLLRVHHRNGDTTLLGMVTHTLQKMREGGIYDQLGGGLCRYSTDHEWLTPHFEKMLYDNALLLWALVAAWQVTGEDRFKQWAYDTVAWLDHDLSHPQGAFYSAEDADSEGEEGKFYVWRQQELEALLTGDALRVALAHWNVTPQGNFEHHANILHVSRPLADTARHLNLTPESAAQALEQARQTLLAARARRVRPLLDDKILTSWNALAISAYARAGAAFDDSALLRRAATALAFIQQNMVDEHGRLLRRWRDGEARYPAYLVDYAQLGVAALDLYEATGDPAHFALAKKLADAIDRLFRREEGGYFDTGHDAEALLVRTQDGYDGVEPSGNAAASVLFARLWGLGAGEDCRHRALHVLSTFAPSVQKMPLSHHAMLEAVHRLTRAQVEVALVGPTDHPEMARARRALFGQFLPHLVLAQAAPQDIPRHVAAGVGLLEGRAMQNDQPTFYVCRHMTCQQPVHTVEALLAQLG